MNIAAEQIVRWHLKCLGHNEQFVEELVATLSLGIGHSEQDSIIALDQIVEEAKQASRQTEDAAAITRLAELHSELTIIEATEKKIGILEQVQMNLNMPDAGLLGNRIRDRKLKDLLSKLD